MSYAISLQKASIWWMDNQCTGKTQRGTRKDGLTRKLGLDNVSCNPITESFLQEMSHAISLQKASCRKCLMQSCRKCLMQSHHRMSPAGNVSCNLITECFLQEMCHAISLQNVSCWKCQRESPIRVK